MPVVDLHSDLLLDIAHRRFGGERDVFRTRHLPALRAADVRVQVLAIFAPSSLLPEGTLRHALRLVDAAQREEQESEGALRLVRTAAQLDAALADGAVAGILSLEGAEPLGREPELFGPLATLGVRLVGLTWNRANDFADGAAEDRGIGLTALGERLLDEIAAAGAGVDVSHLTAGSTHAVLDRFDGPVLASHSNASAVYSSRRNLDDDVLRRLGEAGGVVGINFLRVFLGAGEPPERIAAHAGHVARVAGPAVPACGADFMGFLEFEGVPEPREIGLPPGADRVLQTLPEPARETTYAEAAAHVGAADGDAAAEAFLGGNALAFLRRALGS